MHEWKLLEGYKSRTSYLFESDSLADMPVIFKYLYDTFYRLQARDSREGHAECE